MDDIVDLVSRSDDDLRALIAELEAEERDISRRRRILHGELDILRAELVMRLQRKHAQGESVISADDVAGLSRILAGNMPTAGEPDSGDEPAGDEDAESSVFCPECGIRNSEGASFCVRCGASLIADQPESATTLSYVPGEEDGETTAVRRLRRRRLPGHPQRRRQGGGDVRAPGRARRHRPAPRRRASSSTTSPSRATTPSSCARATPG